MYDPIFPALQSVAFKTGAPAAQAKARFAEDRLLDAVIWCEISPGCFLTEADAMERFGLTRAAARAGLTRLGYDGWAMPQPRTGWLISPITGASIGQVLDARRIAEPALGDVKLNSQSKSELIYIGKLLQPLKDRKEVGAVASRNHYTDRVDNILLSFTNPFTARHLRKLWHHTTRMTRFFENPENKIVFNYNNTSGLIRAVLAENKTKINDTRRSLINEQQEFFLKQLLNSDAPLSPGSGITGQTDQAATFRRER